MPASPGDSLWRTTRMSLVRRAAGSAPGAGRDDAWAELIDTYRRPISVCLRKRVGKHPDAELMVEEFFAYLFTEDVLASMDPAQGRFRAFLQGVMRRYVLRKLHEYRGAGGDEGLAGLLVVDPPPGVEVDEEWTWARTLLDHAVAQLLDAQPRNGRILLQVHGIPPHAHAPTDTAAVAKAHGMEPGAVHQATSRARKELQRCLLSRIAQLADGEDDYEAEKRALLGRLEEARPGLLE